MKFFSPDNTTKFPTEYLEYAKDKNLTAVNVVLRSGKKLEDIEELMVVMRFLPQKGDNIILKDKGYEVDFIGHGAIKLFDDKTQKEITMLQPLIICKLR